MTFLRSFGCLFTYLSVGSCLAFSQTNLPFLQLFDSSSWLERLLKTPVPKFAVYVPWSPAAAPSTCAAVAPLAAMEEPGAEVDTSGLTQATASALERLRQMVTSIGGRFELKSAYRPPEYQEHLQAVWDKWKTLKHNRQKDCQELRTQVAEEFTRHHLLETQRPVSNSDHTRGVGIDAALVLPAGARWKRRRTSLDRLAKSVGFQRPDIRHDPVHFRLLAVVVTASSAIRNPAP